MNRITRVCTSIYQEWRLLITWITQGSDSYGNCWIMKEKWSDSLATSYRTLFRSIFSMSIWTGIYTLKWKVNPKNHVIFAKFVDFLYTYSMQYTFLRGVIESTLSNFVCPHCQSKADEQWIFLTWMTSQWVDINIHCASCHTNTLLHAEVNMIANEMMNSEHGKNFIKEFLQKWWNMNIEWQQNLLLKNENSIKDEDIINMYKNLKNAHSIEDILWMNE